MSNLKVIRKDLFLTEGQLKKIYSFYDDKQGFLPSLDVDFKVNDLLVRLTFRYNFINTIQVEITLYKFNSIGDKEEIMATMIPAKKETLLTNVYKINTQKTTLGQNIDILIKLYEKDIVRDDLYFKIQQICGDFYFENKLEAISYSNLSKKDELFHSMYLFLIDEVTFSDYNVGEIDLFRSEFYREQLNNLILRLEYFGYDKDYYEKYSFEYENMRKVLNRDYRKYGSDDILRFFILSTLGNFYENKVTSYSKNDKSDLYVYFYNKLREEGYYNN